MSVDQTQIVKPPASWVECWHHGLEFAPENRYLVCPECFHVYRRARDLRKAYRRGVWGADPWAPKRRWLRSTPWDISWARAAWMCLKVRASRIYSCPECSHDF